jgi:hypothetical protein
MFMMQGYAAMGDTIASRGITLGAMRGAQAIEDGADRQLMDTPFGERVEVGLRELYDRVWALLDDHRLDVLGVTHALEQHLTITGDDVRAIIEGREGSLVDGRAYHDPVFRQQLLDYHDVAAAAHRDHADVDALLPRTPALALTPGGNGHPAMDHETEGDPSP